MVEEMTFVDVMQAARGEKLEVRWAETPGTGWHPFEPRSAYATNPDELWRSTFRRARPKRSRVQKMAEAESISYPMDVPLIQQTEARYRRAIQAVCEYLRQKVRTAPPSGPHFADEIEREFLEPQMEENDGK